MAAWADGALPSACSGNTVPRGDWVHAGAAGGQAGPIRDAGALSASSQGSPTTSAVRYAPRECDTPSEQILVDVAERGGSLGAILIGAQGARLRSGTPDPGQLRYPVSGRRGAA
jgi:hypothetical protein